MKPAYLMQLLTISFVISTTVTGGCVNQQASKMQNTQETPPVLETHFETDLIIPVVINAKTYRFLVDTGASVTVIDKKLANEVTRPLRQEEIPKNYREEFSNISTVNGSIEHQHHTLVKPIPYFIGSDEIRDNDIWVATDIAQMRQVLGVDIDGIIGIDTIRKLNWLVDNETRRLLLTKDAPSAREWQHCTGYEDSYNRAPQFWFTYGNSNLAFRLDTGANHSYVDQKFIEFAKSQNGTLLLDKKKGLYLEASGIYQEPVYILKELNFNNMPLGELKVSSNPNELFAVGMDFLSRFKRYALIPSRMMFCYDALSIERHGLASLRNLTVRYTGDNIELFYNSEDDLRGTGLRNGDILLKLNDTVYTPAQIGEVGKILELTPRGKLNLTIQRGTQHLEVYL